MSDLKVVGTSVRKVDGLPLACGAPLFVADELPAGILQAKILHSPHAHARILKIDATEARALTGVAAVLTHEDLPRVAITTAGQGAPEPSPHDTFVLDSKMRFVGDTVALVAAETLTIAEAACRLIQVEYELLPAILDPKEAQAEGASIIHDEPEARMPIPVHYEPQKNICAFVDVKSGDIEAAFESSEHCIEGDFQVHYAQHTPIEPHICAGWLDPYGRLILRTSTQVPYHARRITARALEMNVRQVRVIKPRVGGGFGTKQEVLLEPWVGALVRATRRPVLMELSREEEFLSRTRHPQAVSIKTGYQSDGSLKASHMSVLSNTGAYGSHGLTVMTNCGSKTLPLYRREEVAFTGTTVYTNLPVAGAYRGYGGTQASFAQEIQMDEIAERLGLDPLRFRQMNHIQAGEGSPVFAMLGEGKEGVEQVVESCGLADCLTLGAEAIGWSERRGKPGDGVIKRGIGMAALMQGSSIPEIDMASVSIKMNEDGSFNLTAGATDLGTGSDTILAQMAAEVLGVEMETFVVYSSDTDLTPFDVGAYASSTTYLSGMASKKCAEKLGDQIAAVAADELGCAAEAIRFEGGYALGPTGKISFARIGSISLYEHDQHQIAATESAISHSSPPPFAAHFVEVEVDTETGLVRVLKYVAAVDCGRAIHPKLAEGQVEGSVANGISYALTERYIFNEKGKMLNGNFGDYRIFSSVDMPEMVTILVPTVEPTGPFGAKSVSEININGACPAISNAIYDAIGVRLRQTPFTPEAVLEALEARG